MSIDALSVAVLINGEDWSTTRVRVWQPLYASSGYMFAEVRSE
jgi:hypothetical protein